MLQACFHHCVDRPSQHLHFYYRGLPRWSGVEHDGEELLVSRLDHAKSNVGWNASSGGAHCSELIGNRAHITEALGGGPSFGAFPDRVVSKSPIPEGEGCISRALELSNDVICCCVVVTCLYRASLNAMLEVME